MIYDLWVKGSLHRGAFGTILTYKVDSGRHSDL